MHPHHDVGGDCLQNKKGWRGDSLKDLGISVFPDGSILRKMECGLSDTVVASHMSHVGEGQIVHHMDGVKSSPYLNGMGTVQGA